MNRNKYEDVISSTIMVAEEDVLFKGSYPHG
jgi:hypothetical protein